MAAKKEILVVGAGPAGLTAAICLNREGYKVVLQDKQKDAGGEPGWHPSVHSTPVDRKGLWDYIGMNLDEAFINTADHYKMFVNGEYVGNPQEASEYKEYGLYNTERGHRPTSLDQILFRIAEKEGVNFEFGKQFKAEDIDAVPAGTILATGLSPGLYDAWGIPYGVMAGYWAYAECPKGEVSAATYIGGFTNEYGYSSSMNGIWYVLLFARKEVKPEQLQAFKEQLEKIEGRSFGEWRRFMGQSPKSPSLYFKQCIRTGTLAGFVEPALGFGITGAILSGKIAAMTVVDKAKGEKEFERFTKGINAHIARKRQPGYVPTFKMAPVWFLID